MSAGTRQITFSSEEATTAFAQKLAMALVAGDTVLLEGDIGAGKSFLARNIILALLDVPEDIPSPTFTLIQTYDTVLGEVLHTDLYRVSSPEEIIELGLDDAFGTTVCLVEWPDRLAGHVPKDALTIKLQQGATETERLAIFDSNSPSWAARLKECLND